MRPLTTKEIASISGAGYAHYELPAGIGVEATVEPNNSTTLTFTNVPGIGTYSWNSGTFISCHIFSTGVGVGAWAFSFAFTLNPAITAGVFTLTKALVQMGCKNFVTNMTPTNPTEDGDGEY